MKKTIDSKHWKRQEHYEFFKDFQEPFWGITANVDCTKAYQHAKDNKLSFFLYYMYQSLVAVNEIEEFRYRIEDDKVVCYDEVHCSTTALNASGMLAYAFIPYADNFDDFYQAAQKEITAIKSMNCLSRGGENNRSDLIHYSTIPWISFTALTHARNFARADSIPKISFGKYFKDGDRMLLPVSVNGHHGLMDGYHAGRYYELFQELLNRD